MTKPASTSRVEAGPTPKALAIVRRAAELQGRSVSAFVVTAAQDAAHRAIGEAQIIRLSVEDQKAIAAAIIHPPKPNQPLLRAAAAHGRLVRSSE